MWNGEACNRAKDGSLYWVHTTIVPFTDAAGVPGQYIAIRADISKREQDAQRMALHGALTGLPNRRLMGERLEHAINLRGRGHSYGALLLMDLDHFKEINDSLDHAQGDELLRQVAGRLTRSVRQSDTVARLGGDEFVVLLEELGAELATATLRAGGLGENIRNALAAPYELQGQQVTSTPSIGVVLFHRREDQPEELLKQADIRTNPVCGMPLAWRWCAAANARRRWRRYAKPESWQRQTPNTPTCWRWPSTRRGTKKRQLTCCVSN